MSQVDGYKFSGEQNLMLYPHDQQSQASVQETHQGAIKSTVYLTEIHEGTGQLETDVHNTQEHELTQESQGEIMNIMKPNKR